MINGSLMMMWWVVQTWPSFKLCRIKKVPSTLPISILMAHNCVHVDRLICSYQALSRFVIQVEVKRRSLQLAWVNPQLKCHRHEVAGTWLENFHPGQRRHHLIKRLRRALIALNLHWDSDVHELGSKLNKHFFDVFWTFWTLLTAFEHCQRPWWISFDYIFLAHGNLNLQGDSSVVLKN